MPVITVKMGTPHIDKSQELIEKLTTTAADVLEAPESAFTIFIEGYDLDRVGAGVRSWQKK